METRFEQVLQKMGTTLNVARWLNFAADRFQISGELVQSHFIGQMYVESKAFTDTREDFGYRPERLLEVFRNRNGLTTLAQATKIIAGGPGAIAEAVYGAPWGVKKLGNTKPGDGARFIGRGYKQLTGRDNYTRYSRYVYHDDRCVIKPELLELPEDAALSAGWFFAVTSGAIDAARRDNVELVTLRVNGGSNGLQQRRDATKRAKDEFARLR